MIVFSLMLILAAMASSDACQKTEGGTSGGKCCSLPFYYNGKEHNTCIKGTAAQFWCATTYRYDLDRKWGYCVTVSCGHHRELSCSLCPGEHGEKYCNGDCKWCKSNENCVPKETSCPAGVDCGKRRASNCGDCGNDKSSCKGECKWCSGKCQEKSLCVVNGAWNTWTAYDTCSKTCGVGIQRRSRLCNNPAPADGGSYCRGQSQESRLCTERTCAVNGAWSVWAAYDTCSKTCGVGIQRRSRICNNPEPAKGGLCCHGLPQESRLCSERTCAVNGAWSAWGSFGSCSKSCGGGVKNGIRFCNDPVPANGGSSCPGSDKITQQCNMKACPPVNGAWSAWGSFGSCSFATICGGVKTRTRFCNDPVPANGGSSCPGSDKITEKCNMIVCPPGLSIKSYYPKYGLKFIGYGWYASHTDDINLYNISLDRCFAKCAEGRNSGKKWNGLWYHIRSKTCACNKDDRGHLVRTQFVHYRFI